MKKEDAINAILGGVLLNGFIQGQTQSQISVGCLDFAKSELEKVIKKEIKKALKENLKKVSISKAI